MSFALAPRPVYNVTVKEERIKEKKKKQENPMFLQEDKCGSYPRRTDTYRVDPWCKVLTSTQYRRSVPF